MLAHHIKLALRLFKQHKGYSLINVVGLAVGLTTCLLILLFVRDEWRYDTHHEQADQIYRLVTSGTVNGSAFTTARSPAPAGPAMQEALPEVVMAVRVRTPDSRFAVEYESRIFFEKGFFVVDSTFFDVFSHPFLRGDPATALDAPSTVVITEAAARKYFGEEDPIGRTIRADFTHDLTVTGVIAQPPLQSHMHFDFLVSMRTADYWYDTTGGLMINPGFTNWNQRSVYTYVVLAPGTRPEAVLQKMPALVAQHAGPPPPGSQTDFALQALTDIHLQSDLPWEIEANGNMSHLYIFLFVAAVVLLIACINFVNLATARSVGRAKEVGVRKVNGARQGQLVGQLLGESLTVTAVAAGLAVVLLVALLPIFNGLTDKSLPYTALLHPSMLGSLLGLTLLVGVLAGSYPAFMLAASKPVDMMRGTFHGGRTAIRKALVIVQFTISIMLLASLGVIYQQMAFIQQKDLGYERSQVVAIPLSDPQTRGRMEQYRQLLLGNPGVTEVSRAWTIPGEGTGTGAWRLPDQSAEEAISTEGLAVGHDFVEVFDIEVVAGRNFSRSFGTDTTGKVLINQRAAEAFGLEQPIGQVLHWNAGTFTVEIIGVVEDFHFRSLHHQITPMLMFLISPNSGGGLWALAKIQGHEVPETLAFMERTWREVNPGYPFEYRFMDDLYDQQYRAETKFGQVFGYFTLVALLIACLGLFGLVAFTAAQRTKEIGVRKVLGATVGSIIALLTRDFMLLVSLAFVLAVPVTYVMMDHWLAGFAYRSDLSGIPFVLAGSVALLTALLTVSYQAIKAARANPVQSLRYE